MSVDVGEMSVKIMRLPLKTAKIQGETEQQYWAWFLYCNTKSIDDMMRIWELIRTGKWQGDAPEELRQTIKFVGQLPTLRQVERWSVIYRWVERKELKIQEDAEELRKRTKKVEVQKKEKIVVSFGRILDDFFKKAESRKLNFDNFTISDFKKLWEMARTELGETIGKHELDIREEDQKPPTEEEMSGIEDISQAFKTFYEQQWKRPGKETGYLLGNKKQDKK